MKDGLQAICKDCHRKYNIKKGFQHDIILDSDHGSYEVIFRKKRSRRQNFIKKYGEAVAELIPDGYE